MQLQLQLLKREAKQRNLQHHVRLCQVRIRLPALALKPRGDVTRSPERGYQWPIKGHVSTKKEKPSTNLGIFMFLLWIQMFKRFPNTVANPSS